MTEQITSGSIRVETARPAAPAGGNTQTGEASLGELVATASKDLSQLIRQEVQLAKIELQRDVKAAGVGAGLLGAAGMLGFVAFLLLSIALAYALGRVVPLGAGFLIVGAAYLLVAGLFALVARGRLKKVGPPRRTMETVKDDIAWAKHPTSPPPARPGRR